MVRQPLTTIQLKNMDTILATHHVAAAAIHVADLTEQEKSHKSEDAFFFNGEMNERQCKSRVAKKGHARAKVARAQEAPPHPQARADEGRCAGSGKLTWTEASLWKRENMAERSPDVSCAKKKMARNSLLESPKADKKRTCTRPQQHVSNWSVRPAQEKKQRRRLKGDSEAQDARRRSFMFWCAANTSAGISSLPETRPSCAFGPQT